MNTPANDLIPKPGRFRRAFAATRAWLQALDYTGTDYALDRIQRLEEELAALKEELHTKGSAATPGGRPY